MIIAIKILLDWIKINIMNSSVAYIQQSEFLLRKLIDAPIQPIVNTKERFAIRTLAGDFYASSPEKLYEKIEDHIFYELNSHHMSKNFDRYTYANEDVLTGALFGSLTKIRKNVTAIKKIKRLFKEAKNTDNTTCIITSCTDITISNDDIEKTFEQLKGIKTLLNWSKRKVKELYNENIFLKINKLEMSLKIGNRMVYSDNSLKEFNQIIKKVLNFAKKLNDTLPDLYLIKKIKNKYIVNINNEAMLTGTKYKILKELENMAKYGYKQLAII